MYTQSYIYIYMSIYRWYIPSNLSLSLLSCSRDVLDLGRPSPARLGDALATGPRTLCPA